MIKLSARFTDEWAERVRLMADLKPEFPKGVSSVLQEGVERMWAKYGTLAEMMAASKARTREEHNR